MELIAQKREKLGKKAKEVKLAKQIAGVVYGKGLESEPIAIDFNLFVKVLTKAGETDLIDLKIGIGNEKVMIKEVQVDPLSGKPTHVSFYKPNLKIKTKVEVPVEIVGDDANELVKSGAALVLTLLDEIEVEALPMDIPHQFTVDVSKLENIGDGIAIKDLDYDKAKVTLLDVEEDELVVKLDRAEMEEEKEEVVTEAEALEKIEATAETAKEEGEEEAEGKSKSKAKEPETSKKEG